MNYTTERGSNKALSLDQDAYYGTAGDFVTLVEPHSEADPVGLLVTFLIHFGNVAGPGAYFTVEGTRHHANLFAVLVGRTSDSRKGTTHDRVKQLFRLADPEWLKSNCTSGLSSGEGLIHAMRDGSEGPDGCDPGVTDKRLLVVESEFAIVFKQFNRQGNILSTTIRQAWDNGDLSTLSKGSPERATGTHVSILAHITPEELLRSMSETEAANGFGNRFLWLEVKRSKDLPFGGNLTDADLEPLAAKIKATLEFAKSAGEIGFDQNARELWTEHYPRLNRGRRGIVGALTSRAPAQVRRLAMIYALLDRSNTVRVEHLKAALALWSCAERSVTAIFGDFLGDPVADTILDALRRNEHGLTRTEIHGLLGRNRSGRDIGRALKTLAENGLARCTTEGTEGRTCERWLPVEQAEQSRDRHTQEVSSDGVFSSVSFNSCDGTRWKRDEAKLASIETLMAEAPVLRLLRERANEFDKTDDTKGDRYPEQD